MSGIGIIAAISINQLVIATVLASTCTSVKVVESGSNLRPVFLCLFKKVFGLVQSSCGQCMAVLSKTGIINGANNLLHN